MNWSKLRMSLIGCVTITGAVVAVAIFRASIKPSTSHEMKRDFAGKQLFKSRTTVTAEERDTRPSLVTAISEHSDRARNTESSDKSSKKIEPKSIPEGCMAQINIFREYPGDFWELTADKSGALERFLGIVWQHQCDASGDLGRHFEFVQQTCRPYLNPQALTSEQAQPMKIAECLSAFISLYADVLLYRYQDFPTEVIEDPYLLDLRLKTRLDDPVERLEAARRILTLKPDDFSSKAIVVRELISVANTVTDGRDKDYIFDELEDLLRSTASQIESVDEADNLYDIAWQYSYMRYGPGPERDAKLAELREFYPDAPFEFYNQAKGALANGNRDEALKLIRMAIERSKGSYRFVLGSILSGLEQNQNQRTLTDLRWIRADVVADK